MFKKIKEFLELVFTPLFISALVLLNISKLAEISGNSTVSTVMLCVAIFVFTVDLIDCFTKRKEK